MFAMRLNKFIFLCIILGVASTDNQKFKYAEVQLPGSCPKINYLINFDVPRLLGWWYRALTTTKYPQSLKSECLNNEGQTMYAAEYDDTTLRIDACCRSAANASLPTCGNKVGSGTVTFVSNTTNSVIMNYQFGNNTFPIYILDTDYDNFVVVYGCNAGSQHQREEFSVVLSRDYELADGFDKRARSILQRNDIDLSILKPVKQGPLIPYTPGPKPCIQKINGNP